MKKCNEDDHKALIRQTKTLINRLKTGKVCLYPEPQNPPHDVGITEFAECLPFLGDCNMLIFCAPHHSKESAQAEIQHYTGGGDPALLRLIFSCMATEAVIRDRNSNNVGSVVDGGHQLEAKGKFWRNLGYDDRQANVTRDRICPNDTLSPMIEKSASL